MDKERIIAEVFDLYKKGNYGFAIEGHLKRQNLDESEFPEIIQKATVLYEAYTRKKNARKNRIIFFLYLVSAALTFLLFLFVLPYRVKGNETFLSILGSGLFFVFLYLALAYKGTWKEEFLEQQESPTINFGFLIIFIIPAMILYFIMSWRFSSASDDMLMTTKQEAVGKIISGNSTEVKRGFRPNGITYSSVVVEFKTADGTKVTATEDVNEYEFKNFYVGQEIMLIYSKDDPQNIELLTNKASIQKFTEAAERDITPNDLRNLMAVSKENIQKELNKISYGWKFDSYNSLWVNEKENIAVAVSPDAIIYITDKVIVFSRALKNDGFEEINITGQNEAIRLYSLKKEFSKKGFRVNIEPVKEKNSQGMAMIIMSKTNN